MTELGPFPGVGIGYRVGLDVWTRKNLDRFDVIEVTVDHYINDRTCQSAVVDLAGRVPLTAHGVGLSIGTDAPLDLSYLDQVAAIVERHDISTYSEHLAFTRVPGRALPNLLPLPTTEAVAESIIAKVRTVQSIISVPFLLENIAAPFKWPNSTLSDADFLNLICQETGAGVLLDVENLFLNFSNYGSDPKEFIDALPPGVVREVHVAGGITLHEPFLENAFHADTHSHPVPEAALDILDYLLVHQTPANVILERDDRLDAREEILDDMARIRARIVSSRSQRAHD